jgi:hypothetical protein
MGTADSLIYASFASVVLTGRQVHFVIVPGAQAPGYSQKSLTGPG